MEGNEWAKKLARIKYLTWVYCQPDIDEAERTKAFEICKDLEFDILSALQTFENIKTIVRR